MQFFGYRTFSVCNRFISYHQVVPVSTNLILRKQLRLYSTTEVEKEVKSQKYSTGIPGVRVIPRSREILIRMYEKYLEELKKFEEGTPYRSHMEKVTAYRLGICKSTEDIFEIEDKIGMGQIEELIDMQEDEFKLIPFMLEHKPWQIDEKWDRPIGMWSNILQ